MEDVPVGDNGVGESPRLELQGGSEQPWGQRGLQGLGVRTQTRAGCLWGLRSQQGLLQPPQGTFQVSLPPISLVSLEGCSAGCGTELGCSLLEQLLEIQFTCHILHLLKMCNPGTR